MRVRGWVREGVPGCYFCLLLVATLLDPTLPAEHRDKRQTSAGDVTWTVTRQERQLLPNVIQGLSSFLVPSSNDQNSNPNLNPNAPAGESNPLLDALAESAIYQLGQQVLGPQVAASLRPYTYNFFPRPSEVKDFVSDSPVRIEAGKLVLDIPNRQDAAQVEAARSCRTPQGGSGKCLDLNHCPELILDFLQLRGSVCFRRLFVPGVCCPDRSSSDNRLEAAGQAGGFAVVPATTLPPLTTTTTTTTTTTPPPPPSSSASEGLLDSLLGLFLNRPSNGLGGQPPQLGLGPVPPAAAQARIRCGVSVAPTFRVVGGVESRPGQWPWMAAIFLHGPRKTEFWCGGTLVSNQHILTAAHCTRDSKQRLFDPRQFTVRMGDHDLLSPAEPGGTQTFRVAEIRIHPRFISNGFYNDIAVFKLDRPVQYNDYIRPVCLPTPRMRTEDFVGTTPSVIGWGSTRYGGQESQHLRHVPLPVWRNEDCDRAYFQPIGRNFICAGVRTGGRDACQGDSGGPLLLDIGGAWHQIGLVSFGNKCAEAGYPGVYTRITEYLDWLAANLV